MKTFRQCPLCKEGKANLLDQYFLYRISKECKKYQHWLMMIYTLYWWMSSWSWVRNRNGKFWQLCWWHKSAKVHLSVKSQSLSRVRLLWCQLRFSFDSQAWWKFSIEHHQKICKVILKYPLSLKHLSFQ